MKTFTMMTISMCLAAWLAAALEAQAGELKAGDPAPNFELPEATGRLTSSDFKNKKAVVALVPKKPYRWLNGGMQALRASGPKSASLTLPFRASCDPRTAKREQSFRSLPGR